MGQRAPESIEPEPPSRPTGPSIATALLLALLLFLALVANGRPIGAGDARPTERVAASLVSEGNFDLDEYPEVEPPFARETGGHRWSIYPVLSAVLAAPLFAVARHVVLLDDLGCALVGKTAASLLSALAAAALFLAVGRRRPESEAFQAALVFALGTTVWSTSQALWQHPAAVLFLSLAILFILEAEYDDAWAGRTGGALALAVAARHADVALVAVVTLAVWIRWPRRIPTFLLWAAPVVALVLAYQWYAFGSVLQHGFSGTLESRFSAPWGTGHLGLLVSPAKGLLVFTPVVIVAGAGLVRAFRRGDRWLAGSMAAAVLAHWALVGRWSEWHGGESWGPRLMTDALPCLLLFLPEGFDVLPRAGAVLAIVSIAVQALGAFAYDYRWERLYQRSASADHAELWDWARSPIVFYAHRRVLLPSLPAIRNGHALLREHPIVLGGAEGSRVTFAGDDPAVMGTDATLGDVFLERGARVQDGRLLMKAHWDGLFLRVQPVAQGRSLELRIVGRGQGTLYVGESSFWSDGPKYATYPIHGPFRIRHPYQYATSGGPDLRVTTGRSPGDLQIDSVALVPPNEPDDVIRR